MKRIIYKTLPTWIKQHPIWIGCFEAESYIIPEREYGCSWSPNLLQVEWQILLPKECCFHWRLFWNKLKSTHHQWKIYVSLKRKSAKIMLFKNLSNSYLLHNDLLQRECHDIRTGVQHRWKYKGRRSDTDFDDSKNPPYFDERPKIYNNFYEWW